MLLRRLSSAEHHDPVSVTRGPVNTNGEGTESGLVDLGRREWLELLPDVDHPRQFFEIRIPCHHFSLLIPCRGIHDRISHGQTMSET